MTSEATGDGRYEADIRWTTHGVPHIRAADWGSLGFGQGWACARDHLPTIADQITKVRSQRARFFGRGDGDRHLHSDLGYLALDVPTRAARMAADQPAEIVELIDGYAAGISAWLAEHGTGDLPEWARHQPWVRPVTAEDLYHLYVDLALMGSGRNLAEYVGAAVPPGADPHGHRPAPEPPADGRLDGGLGSNGWAFGRAATASGGGMVMANPHFPWYGEARFWECHLTLPGELDVYGASLIGTPGVQIGFNEHVAWTHTFSAGHRFTAYTLSLVDGDPTRYRYGDEERAMVATDHAVEVLGDDGELTTVERATWASHYGPVISLPMVGWSEAMAFTYRDANEDNTRVIRQFLAMDRAGSVDDLRQAIATHQGLPWVNTLAADDTGTCWYADASTTPNLTEAAQAAFEERLTTDPLAAFAFTMRVALLDGSDPTFEWQDHPDAPLPGVVPFDQLPQLERDDHLFNANDPYWLPHGEVQLPRHSTFCGLHRRRISPRTRMNALLAGGQGPVQPTGPDGRFTLDDVEAAVLGNHSLMADLLLDEVLARLDGVGTVEVDGHQVELTPAAEVLAEWDRRYDVDSVGAVVWRELLAGFPEEQLRDAGPLFAEPFDPDRPVHTPRGLAPAPADGPDPVVAALARAVLALQSASVPLDAPLGDVQWVERAGRRVGVHGAHEVEGIANVLAPVGSLARSDLEPEGDVPAPVPGRTERTGLRQGGYPVIYGTSFLMLVELGPDGPTARGLLAYGQSGDPAAERSLAQIEAYAAKALRPLRFRDADIDADPELVRQTVRG